MNKTLSAVSLALALFGIMVSAPSIFGLLTKSVTIANSGIVTVRESPPPPPPAPTIDFKVYSDSQCMTEATEVDWGSIFVGSTKNATIYVRNEGNTPITLSLNTTNWSPPDASGYISLSWDYSGQNIAVGSVIKVTLILSVSPSVSSISSFTFSIIITGTQA